MVELQTFQKHFNYRPGQCSNILLLNVNNFVKNFNHFKIPRERLLFNHLMDLKCSPHTQTTLLFLYV